MMVSSNSILRTLLCAVAGLSGLPMAAQTVTGPVCTVPGSHATIQHAIDNPACATIALASQTYPESLEMTRSLSVVGPGTGDAVILGLILALGASTQVTLQDLQVGNSCAPAAMRAADGAEILGSRLRIRRSALLPCPLPVSGIFFDGFESGDLSAWSDVSPAA